MTSVRHDDMMRFTSRGRQRRSKVRSDVVGSGGANRIHRGVLGNGYQVWPDLVTRAECIKVSRGAGIPKRTVTYT